MGSGEGGREEADGVGASAGAADEGARGGGEHCFWFVLVCGKDEHAHSTNEQASAASRPPGRQRFGGEARNKKRVKDCPSPSLSLPPHSLSHPHTMTSPSPPPHPDTTTAIRAALLDAAASVLASAPAPADADAAATAASTVTAAALDRVAALRLPLTVAVVATVHARTGGGHAAAGAGVWEEGRDGGVGVAWEGEGDVGAVVTAYWLGCV